MLEFKLPEVGENIKSGTVVNIMVSVGQTVSKGQDLIELETEKASLPVPSPSAGVIKEILVKVGQEAKIGSVIMRIEAGSGKEAPAQAPKQSPTPVKEEAKPKPAQPSPQTTAHSPQPSTVDSGLSTKYDTQLVVIGAGPGGYAAAFLTADLGLKVSLVDPDVNPGGVCLYRGCIPSKALLHAAKVVSEARAAKHFGLEFAQPKIDITKLREWKNSVVNQLTGGLGQISKLRKVNYIRGMAAFTNSNTLSITKSDGTKQTLTFDKAIIATGSRPIKLPGAPESKNIMDSTSALELQNIPKSLLLVGGGYIGLELGTVYAELGSEVSVVEMLPQLMTGADRDLANILEKRLTTIFKEIMVSTKIVKVEKKSSGINITFENHDGKPTTRKKEKILVYV